MIDLNYLQWHSQFAAKRLDHVRKSGSIYVSKAKITGELQGRKNMITEQIKDVLQSKYMAEFANIFDDPKRKPSMLTLKPEGAKEPNSDDMGLMSFMTKTIMEDQQSSMKSAVAMHQEKSKRLEAMVEAKIAKKWRKQQKMLDHSIRQSRDKLHEVRKIMDLIKPSTQRVPIFKYE